MAASVAAAAERAASSSSPRSSTTPSSSAPPPPPPATPPLVAASATLSAAAILRARESSSVSSSFRGAGGGGGGGGGGALVGGLGPSARAYLTNSISAPCRVAGLGDDRPSRAYVGFFTSSGNLFVCGYQNDRRIRVYDCGVDGLGSGSGGGGSGGGGGGSFAIDDDNGGDSGEPVGTAGWRLVKDISCRLLRWTVTDAVVVPGGGGGGIAGGGSGGGGGGGGGWSDESRLLYSTISPVVHCVSLGGGGNIEDGDDDDGNNNFTNNRDRNRNNRSNDRIRSIANTTDVHEPLPFDEMTGSASPDDRLPAFGIWSIRWNPETDSSSSSSSSGGSNVVLAGASDGCVYLHDASRAKTVARFAGAHDDDVNAVVYLAGGDGSHSPSSSSSSSSSLSCSPFVFASGSDDATIKVWDSRVASRAFGGSSVSGNNDRNDSNSNNNSAAFHAVARPVGVLLGHATGITYLDARGDGHHLLSNSKDQTAKVS